VEHDGGDLSVCDVEALRAAAAEIANQDGRGLRRRALLNLAGRPFSISILRPNGNGAPVVAVVQARLQASPDLFDALTTRELEVAGLVARGLTNKRIAAALGISVGTVKDHVHRILVKTGLETRAAVAARWRQR
jgi:DNA-binding NarL/FixJ family response regulator